MYTTLSRKKIRRRHPSETLRLLELFGGGVLLSEAEAAEVLQLSAATLRDWRGISERRGPPWVKIERRPVRYRLVDLKAYLKKRTVRTGGRK
jgi:predicted DNA-binding transcriptional regulator AlpA